MRRAAATGNSAGKVLFVLNWFIGSIRIERIHPLECGFVRLKFRRDRRSGMPIEPALTLLSALSRRACSSSRSKWLWLWGRMYRRYQAIKRDRRTGTYMDEALTPVADDEDERLDIFQTGEAKAYVAQERRLAKVRAGAA